MAFSVASRGAADSAMVRYISRKDLVTGAKRRNMSDKPSPFTPQQALEVMQKMWNPFGLSMPGVMQPAAPGVAPAAPPSPNPLTMFPTLDPVELDKKIGDRRAIENR